jgi:hypothetical protein
MLLYCHNWDEEILSQCQGREYSQLFEIWFDFLVSLYGFDLLFSLASCEKIAKNIFEKCV